MKESRFLSMTETAGQEMKLKTGEPWISVTRNWRRRTQRPTPHYLNDWYAPERTPRCLTAPTRRRSPLGAGENRVLDWFLNRTNRNFSKLSRRDLGSQGSNRRTPERQWGSTGENLKSRTARNPARRTRVSGTNEVAAGGGAAFVDYAWLVISRYGHLRRAVGGNTPRRRMELLASAEFRGPGGWAKVHVFWSDERAVPRSSG